MNTELEWWKWVLFTVVMLVLGYVQTYKYRGYKDWKERMRDYLKLAPILIFMAIVAAISHSCGS